MSLKALAEAALQQCVPRTIDRTLHDSAPAHSPPQQETVRTLSDAETTAMTIAERAIALAALSAEKKQQRLADLRRDPAIARFWALVWPDSQTPPKENP